MYKRQLSQSEKVVVSTHTIALQEQILQSDIKFLQKNLGFAFKAAVLKLSLIHISTPIGLYHNGYQKGISLRHH